MKGTVDHLRTSLRAWCRAKTRGLSPLPCFAVVLLVLLLVTVAWADVIYLKNDTTVEGVIKRETDTQVVIITDAGTLYIDRADIDRIEKADFKPVEVPKPEKPAPPKPPTTPTPRPTTPSGPAQPGEPTAPQAPGKLTFNELRELDLRPSTRWMRVLTTSGPTEQPEKGASGATFYHRGYDHVVLGVLPRDAGYRVTSESVLLRYSLELDYFSVVELDVDRKFQPIKFSLEFLTRREHHRVEGERKGDKLVITTTQGEEKKVKKVDYPSGYVVFDGSLLQFIASGGLRLGGKAQYKFFDVLSGLRGVEQLEVLRQETIPVDGRSTDTFVVKTTTHLPGSPPGEALRWVAPPDKRNPGGRVVRSEPAEGGFRCEYTSKEKATALVGEAVEGLGLREKLFGKQEGQ